MKTYNSDNGVVNVAETTAEALEMFKRQLKKRKQMEKAIRGDDPDKYNGWDDENPVFSSYRSNRNYYDYGDQGTKQNQGTENVPYFFGYEIILRQEWMF